ncbi:MAG: hypothetical protein ACI3ZS_02975 [Candidatus Cryptobacteroides sp.]
MKKCTHSINKISAAGFSILATIVSVSSIAISCERSGDMESDGQGKRIVINATVAIDDAPSLKTSLGADGRTILWDKGDEISVFGADATNSRFTTDIEDAALTASFSGVVSEETEDYFAVFPYSASSAYVDGKVSVNIPAIQEGTAGSFDRAANASIAQGRLSDESVVFKNICAAIKFSISDAGVTGVRFSGNESEPLAGVIKVDYNGGEPTYEVIDGKTSVTLSPEEGTFANGTYYMTLLPQTLSSGFTIEFLSEDDSYSKSTSKSVTLKRSEILDITLPKKTTGTGVESDPYIVYSGTDLNQIASEYPKAYIKLGTGIVASDWKTITSFDGVIDGNGYTVSKMDAPFSDVLAGTVQNVRFVDANIVAGTTRCGIVANSLSGAVKSVAVYGTLTAKQNPSSGDTGLSSIAGQASGTAVVDNCYVNVETEIATGVTNFAYGGLVGVIKETNNVTMSNSTVAGTIKVASNIAKVGGVLGRKTNQNQTSKDIITGCLVEAEITITGTGSNMIGGIFGALQGSTQSDGYAGGLKIEKSAFTGKVSAGNAVAGIGGVCCTVSDCYVCGSVQATSVAAGSTSSSASGIAAAGKGNITRCVVTGSRITGGSTGSIFAAGIVSKKDGNSSTTSSCYVSDTIMETGAFAIYGKASADITATGNYRWNVTYKDESAYVAQDEDTYGQDGTEKQMEQSDFETLGYDFANVWSWDAEKKVPVLKNVGCAASVML